jgi:hypothetical protein
MEACASTRTSNITGVHGCHLPCSAFRGECSHLKQLGYDEIVNYITIDSNAYFKILKMGAHVFLYVKLSILPI